MAADQSPDFTFPSLSPDEPGLPALTFPDSEQPDPPRPTLLQPAPVPQELCPLVHPLPERPDPPLDDLLAPILPSGLLRLPPNEHALGQVSATPILGEVPTTPAPDIAALAASSPDAQSLPSGLLYNEIRTTQDNMTHRLRHLAPLLQALLSAERGLSPEQEGPDVY
ncbi:hypothetical protein [Thermogemmatispora sp.]|uniref:hypothetical protein n=1 Tax=Thermogemmatispora sp. TaxID=1968838 RepID=UPI001D4A658C|nr:hypothetical protein [Thermogemmatispora sp.]MBX5450675.1 hypothetical protein [Thermogemmatispora sp.]